jgi:hypothetical protein
VVACWAAVLANIAIHQRSLSESRKSEAVAVGARWIDVVYKGGTDTDLNLVRGYRSTLSSIEFADWLRKVALSPNEVKVVLRQNILVSHYESDSFEKLRIRSSLNKFLNFLESICLAYLHHTADRTILDESTIPCVQQFATLLRPYMDCIRESEPTTWQAIYDISFPNGFPTVPIVPIDSNQNIVPNTGPMNPNRSVHTDAMTTT